MFWLNEFLTFSKVQILIIIRGVELSTIQVIKGEGEWWTKAVSTNHGDKIMELKFLFSPEK